MRISTITTPFFVVLSFLSTFISAEPMLVSTSLNTCAEDSGFSASLFQCVFTPNNGSAAIDIVAVISIEGFVVFDISISAYGYEIIRKTIDPCNTNLAGLCPMKAGKMQIPPFNLPIDESAIKQIPGIAYNIPDLDATVRVFVNTTDGNNVACVEADISNGKTVDLLGVKWATAIIAGLALSASAVVSGLGHSNTAAHIAANALSLFSYFQAIAMLGLTSVHLPPIVASWVQDFVWSMGIIRVGFMQDIFTWYQRATGGTPSTLFDSLRTISVSVEKRSIDVTKHALNLFKRAASMMPRALIPRNNVKLSDGNYVVFGIQRVAFRAKIESTNLFMTGLTFFCIFVIFTVVGVVAFKGICELAVKKKWMNSEKFQEFRNGWKTVLKGILFRMALIGFPQMTILCLWEFTQRDSPAEVVLAVFFFFGISITLGWAASKVIRIARRSVAMHRNPAYILFSDPQALNKWGFLYVQFRASAYYFVVPTLGYLLVKGMFVAFAQKRGAGIVQAIGFVLIEAGALIAASVLRPWMDKSTNSFNIAICAVNFLNAIFLLIFSNVFGAPPLVVGVVGVVYFIVNAVFALVLLIMLIVSTTLVFFRKNPDARYQAMADDRASFMKSQTQLTTTTELDALAATARMDGKKSQLDLDDDNESLSSTSMQRRAENMPLPQSTGHSQYSLHNEKPPHSPINPSLPLFPGAGDASPYRNHGPSARAPSPYGHGPNQGPSHAFRQQHNASPSGFRQQNNASPWQRGAGYD